jgi:hypothetical protein
VPIYPSAVVPDLSDIRVGFAARLKDNNGDDALSIRISTFADKNPNVSGTNGLLESTGLKPDGAEDTFLGWQTASIEDGAQILSPEIRNDGDGSHSVGFKGCAVFMGYEI